MLGKFETPVVVSFHPYLARCLLACRKRDAFGKSQRQLTTARLKTDLGNRGNFEGTWTGQLENLIFSVFLRVSKRESRERVRGGLRSGKVVDGSPGRKSVPTHHAGDRLGGLVLVGIPGVGHVAEGRHLEWIPRKTTSSAFAVELAVRSLTSQGRS